MFNEIVKPVLTATFTLPYIDFAKASIGFIHAHKSDLVVLVKDQWLIQADTGLLIQLKISLYVQARGLR